jgi:hypothetical protein
MVIWQRTFGFKGWEAKVAWGDSSFGQVEPTAVGGWQVRFFRGLSDLGPYPVRSLEQGQRYLKRFGDRHAHHLAFSPGRDFRMRPKLDERPTTCAFPTSNKKERRRMPKQPARVQRG